MRETIAAEDEGIRADTPTKRVADQAGDRGGCISAGNASQFSDGASARWYSDKEAAETGLGAPRYLPRLRGRSCDPREMGIGPVFACRNSSSRRAKNVSDIDLWS